MTASYQQLIGGEWCAASTGETRSVINPATEEAVAEVPYGAGADCAAAIDAAQHAFAAWASRTAYERAA